MKIRDIALVLALVLGCYVGTREDPLRSLRQPRCDFLAFHWAARSMWTTEFGPHQAVDVAQSRSGATTGTWPDWQGRAFVPRWLYPPTSALLLSPFGILDEYPSQILWYAVLLAATGAIIYLSAAITFKPWVGILVAIWLAPTFLACLQGSCPELVNTALVLWAALLLHGPDHTLWSQGSLRWWAGALLALPCLIKPGVELAWFWPMVAIDRHRCDILKGMAACVVTVVGLSILRWGPDPWWGWTQEWSHVAGRANGYSRAYSLCSVLWLVLAIRWRSSMQAYREAYLELHDRRRS